jgi:hypothetical protein
LTLERRVLGAAFGLWSSPAVVAANARGRVTLGLDYARAVMAWLGGFGIEDEDLGGDVGVDVVGAHEGADGAVGELFDGG